MSRGSISSCRPIAAEREGLAPPAAAPGRWALRWRRLCAASLAAGLLLAAGTAAHAHESEQYTLPAGRDFADLGPLLSHRVLSAIRGAVADTNAAIDQALESNASSWQLQNLQSADYVAAQVWGRLFATFPANELLDLGLISATTRAMYPGLVTMYRPVESIYDDPWLLIDLSKPVRALFRAGTVSAGGVLFGTDKIIHFINLGRIYHSRYLDALGRGLSEPDALQHAVRSTASNPLLSEDGMLGLFTTGIHSNGDLAADYAGLKFYRNLTESVRIGALQLPPMLQRDGPHWRVVLRHEAMAFTVFVTPHWNEVLNPNTYLSYVGERVRSLIGTRCDDVFDWYRDGLGRPLDRAAFVERQNELATFHGEPYGHELRAEHPVSAGLVCWPPQADHALATYADPAQRTQLSWGTSLPAAQVGALGRGALWWAAAAGQAQEVQRLAARGEAIDRQDDDGETPLHAAVRHGHVETAQLLLARGADANRTARHGVTPLMLAVLGGHEALAEALLQAGVDPNAQDRFGTSALHEAARRGDHALALLLLRHGADATLASRQGIDALQLAQRAGHDELGSALRAFAPATRKPGAAGQAMAESLPDALAQPGPVR